MLSKYDDLEGCNCCDFGSLTLFTLVFTMFWHRKLQTHTYLYAYSVIQIIVLYACHILGRKKYHLHPK